MLLNTNNLDLLKTLPMDRAISEATAWMENELDLSKMETAKKIIDILNTRFNSNRDSDDSIFTLDHAKDMHAWINVSAKYRVLNRVNKDNNIIKSYEPLSDGLVLFDSKQTPQQNIANLNTYLARSRNQYDEELALYVADKIKVQINRISSQMDAIVSRNLIESLERYQYAIKQHPTPWW